MLGTKLGWSAYLDRFQRELSKVDAASIQRWSDALFSAWQGQKQVFIIGNGGSGTTASHLAEDLAKGTIPDASLNDEEFQRLRVQSLTDNVGWIMAVGNDLAYDQIFVQQLMNLAQAGDLLIAISGSGNSPNILNAVDWANRHGVKTFGLTGYSGGQLQGMQQDGIHVALDDMGMVESIHLGIHHWVLNDLFARINRVDRHAE
ncbi:MAG: SIS domain-containing protein [Planctomycetota bacterium]|nr:SIS domain-containing protein [Planctomycetota bacterium]MEC7597339.1 SIS domain-containing protein [Planctomycetota bacterium]MEC8412004.1 SIS domain-containing protein [Planctomycetota bacterium]